MKWFIPHEHGAWSMWVTPYLIGALVTPWTFMKIVGFVAIFFLFMAMSAFIVYIRNPRQKEKVYTSGVIYLFTGLILISVVLWEYPTIIYYGLLITPLLLVNIFFAKRKKERLFINDLAAITGLSVTCLVSYHIGMGGLNREAFIIWAICMLFFIGSIFFIKSVIREKKNKKFKTIAFLYHIVIVLIPILMSQVWLSVVFLPSLLRIGVIWRKKSIRPKISGSIEIVNSILFVIFMLSF